MNDWAELDKLPRPKLRPSSFGAYYDMSPVLPAGTSSMIVAVSDYGLKPQRLLLAHQLYEKNVRKMLEGNATEVWVHPVIDNGWRRVA